MRFHIILNNLFNSVYFVYAASIFYLEWNEDEVSIQNEIVLKKKQENKDATNKKRKRGKDKWVAREMEKVKKGHFTKGTA